MAFVRARPFIAALLATVSIASDASAQDRGLSYTIWGTPGLLEMPSALSADDGEVAATYGMFGNNRRTTLTFQIAPRLSGSFRYSGFDVVFSDGVRPNFDRSFDLRYRLVDEGEWMPSVAIGLQDFLGTTFYGGEYIVATKTISDSIRVTGGLGWGRLASNGGFSNPLSFLGSYFETRPPVDFGKGGVPAFENLFRGDAAFFGGVEYAINERLTFKAEYSSDAYVYEETRDLMEVNSPFNFGLTYRPAPGYQVGLAYMYGSEIALMGTVTLNPNDRPFDGGMDPAPQPVLVRAADMRAAQSWDRAELPEAVLHDRLNDALAAEGITLNGVELTDGSARVRYTNNRYRAEAQALGRVARIMTRELPPSIEVLTLEPMQAGIPLSATTLRRSDLEAFENQAGGTDAMQARAVLADAGPVGGIITPEDADDPFSWRLSPYGRLILFDGGNPVAVDVGLRLRASYEFRPNLVASGSLTYQLYSNQSEAELVTDDTVPVVRRNAGLYAQEGSPGIESLTLAYYGRPGANLYSRVTLGYLEQMYGGVSAEMLWKPVDSRLAVGAEVNYVAQRDFDMLLGFQDYEVATGHASVYYDLSNGFHAQLDLGRYLAGDLGATFSLDRQFANGWSIGAYATLTDMPFEDFGEGSFDKGIRVSIPIDFVLGQPTRRTSDVTLRSLNRDGGARLNVDGRLYDIVRDGHSADLDDGWGRFWR